METAQQIIDNAEIEENDKMDLIITKTIIGKYKRSKNGHNNKSRR